MQYDICKELKPEDTIKTIKSILNKQNINIIETINEKHISNNVSIVSVSLKLGKMPISHGKGISLNNAKASAYGELMERLQNQMLFRNAKENEFIFSPDEIICKIEDLEKTNLSQYFFNKDIIIKLEKIISSFNKEKPLLVPFYNIKTNEKHLIPIHSLLHLQMSNGMCSGNTKEEALVQGLSEIFERYAIKEIMKNNIKLQVIPYKFYKKYDTITSIIKYYESNNYNVQIKNASLGRNLPVICAQIEDKKNNILHLSFGAHPYLPVAIERCLTEFIQCRNFKDFENNHFFEDERFFSASYINYLIKNDIYALCTSMSMRHTALEINERLKKQFLDENIYCNDLGNTWITNSEKKENSKLLSFLINNTENVTNNNIFIRNVSYLGFHSFYIFIPEISELQVYNTEKINKLEIMYNWYDKEIEENSEYNNIYSLLSALELRIQNRFVFDNTDKTKLPAEYIALLCSIVLGDSLRIKIYSNILLSHKMFFKIFNKKTLNLFRIIKDFYSDSNEKNRNKEFKINQLKTIYKEEEILFMINFVNSLNYKIIKKIFYRNKIISIKQKRQKDNINEIKNISNQLRSQYSNNIPQQKTDVIVL